LLTLQSPPATAQEPGSASAFREVLRIPWSAALPYERTDTGGAEDNVPHVLHRNGDGGFWIAYTWGRPLLLVDSSGDIEESDLEEAFAIVGVEIPLTYAFGIATAADESTAVLVGGRSRQEGAFCWAIARYSSEGELLDAVQLPSDCFGNDSPAGLSIGPHGAAWIAGFETAWVFENGGSRFLREAAEGPGKVLPSGRHISDRDLSRSVGPGARIVDTDDENRFLAIREEHAVEVYLGRDRGRAFDLDVTRVASLPLLELRDTPQDGAGLSSWFPPEGIAFDDDGGVVAMEVTAESLVIRRLSE